MHTNIITQKSKQVLSSFTPARVLQSRLHKRVIMDFAEKMGLVYFGYVDQRDDDHRLVRGLTVSANLRDNHYCIGTYDGYDITLVERSDLIKFPGKPSRQHNWLIMEFDLHTKKDLPHVFLGLHTHSDTFYAHLFTKFSKLARLPLGTFGAYDPSFIDKYTIYAEPAHAITVEQLLDQATTKQINDHFGGMTVEIAEGCLYLYAEHQRPTKALLEKMIQYGAWLARSIDERA